MVRFRDGPRSELDRVDHENLTEDLKILKSRHEKFCSRILGVLPSGFTSLESNRMTVVFFAVSSLDVLGSLDSVLSPEIRRNVVDWIYRLQAVPEPENPSTFRHGFRGSTTFRASPSRTTKLLSAVDGGHLAMTYTALATLAILGDDLSGVDRAGVIEGLRKLQQEDGSFIASPEAAENDMRFVFCAAAVCSLINDWSGMDVEKAADYVKKSLRYDGGVAQGPGLESHGGSTYCALAALTLMGKLETTFNAKERDGIRRWCLFRLHQGFQVGLNRYRLLVDLFLVIPFFRTVLRCIFSPTVKSVKHRPDLRRLTSKAL